MNSTYTLKKNYVFPKHINFKKTLKPIIIVLLTVILSAVFLDSIIEYEENYRIKNISVIEFKEDINKLIYASMLLETGRINSDSKEFKPFGGLNYIQSGDLNDGLKKYISDPKTNNVDSLGIMSLNPDLYNSMIKELNMGSLISDNNLNHYVVITKGNKAGTILYNGPKKFKDINNKQYFGLEAAF